MTLSLPFRLRLAPAPLFGAALLALANAADVAWTVRWPPGGARARALHHTFDALTTLGVGVAAALLLGTFGHLLRRRPWTARAAYLSIASFLAYLILGQDLHHQIDHVALGLPGHLLFALFVVLCGAALPVAHALGGRLARGRITRWIARAAAAGGVLVSHLIVRDDYAGLHAAIEWTAATLSFATLDRPATKLGVRRAGRAVIAALAIAGALGIAVPPPNHVRVDLFRAPGAIGAWAMALTIWPRPPAPSVLPESEPTPVYSPPTAPVAPTEPRLVEGAPVVVMITIDAVRADVVFDRRNEKKLPLFTELSHGAATFTRAISPGSQTSVSLSTMFSGLYFSQLHWSRFGRIGARYLYPAEDRAPRFPEILARSGVTTVLFGGANFLTNEHGVARGFTESTAPDTRRHAMASEVIDPLLTRLSRVGGEPTFLYAHIMEPHWPYDRGKLKEGPELDRYLSEITAADAHVGRVAHALAQRFPTRGLLIVSSDHGEAFGEHGTRQHTKTLYDELLHVPLFIRGAKVRPRRIDARVSLVDVGPTLLDVFGVPTPPGLMGQSLVPLLRGRDAVLARPILAEGRLRRALYDGQIKVIEDLRRKVIEAYDLDRDPGELVNLFDTADPRAARSLTALRAFFDRHALHRPGDSPPYKP